MFGTYRFWFTLYNFIDWVGNYCTLICSFSHYNPWVFQGKLVPSHVLSAYALQCVWWCKALWRKYLFPNLLPKTIDTQHRLLKKSKKLIDVLNPSILGHFQCASQSVLWSSWGYPSFSVPSILILCVLLKLPFDSIIDSSIFYSRPEKKGCQK